MRTDSVRCEVTDLLADQCAHCIGERASQRARERGASAVTADDVRQVSTRPALLPAGVDRRPRVEFRVPANVPQFAAPAGAEQHTMTSEQVRRAAAIGERHAGKVQDLGSTAERCKLTDLLADQCAHCQRLTIGTAAGVNPLTGAVRFAAPAGDDRDQFGPTFPASYPGQCAGCLDRINEGDSIRHSDPHGGFIHEGCEEE